MNPVGTVRKPNQVRPISAGIEAETDARPADEPADGRCIAPAQADEAAVEGGEEAPEQAVPQALEPVLRGVVRLQEQRAHAPGLSVSELNADSIVETAMVSANWR